jgi:geranylgeranyl diphosphate synthase type II
MADKMYTFDTLYHLFSEELKKQNFSKSPKELYEPIIYTVSQSGKRLRPIFTLMACDLFGHDISEAMNQALAIELLHNFTLIHDDIMDEAPLRHGQQTVHKKWNQNIAILAGDTMYALAYRYAMDTDSEVMSPVLQTFNNTALEACEGQQMDINFENKPKVSKEDYLLMIKYKTAVLFGASMRIGALIGRAPKEDVDHLYLYGQNIGMAFQLKDDLLDLYGDLENFGKKTGLDIIESKKTYLYVAAIEKADEETKKKLRHCYRKDHPDPDKKIAEVKAIFDALQIEKVTQDAIEYYLNQSLYHLAQVNQPAERKTILENLAKKLMFRKK